MKGGKIMRDIDGKKLSNTPNERFEQMYMYYDAAKFVRRLSEFLDRVDDPEVRSLILSTIFIIKEKYITPYEDADSPDTDRWALDDL